MERAAPVLHLEPLMELTAEAVMDLLRSLRSDDSGGNGGGSSPSGRRPRQLPRVGVRMKLVILPIAGEADDNATPPPPPPPPTPPAPVAVRVRNLSPRGLGFIHNQPLPVGQEFLILLPRHAGGIAHLLGRVQRCRELEGGGAYDIGAAICMDVPREILLHHVQNARRCA